MDQWTEPATHHRPIVIAVPAQPAAGEHKALTLTRDIARRLGARLGRPADVMSYSQFPSTAPAELHGWSRHQIGIGGHTVVIVGTPEPYLPTMPRYRIQVDGAEAPYQFTFSRPLALVLADAAYQAITDQRAARRTV